MKSTGFCLPALISMLLYQFDSAFLTIPLFPGIVQGVLNLSMKHKSPECGSLQGFESIMRSILR